MAKAPKNENKEAVETPATEANPLDARVTELEEQVNALTEEKESLQHQLNEKDDGLRSAQSEVQRVTEETRAQMEAVSKDATKEVDHLRKQLVARGPVKQTIDRVDGLSYPPPARDVRNAQGVVLVKGDPAQRAKFEKWKEQGRTKCAHRACHYPLNIIKDKDRQPVVMSSPDGTAFEAVCSWDPNHRHPEGGPQYVLCETIVEQES